MSLLRITVYNIMKGCIVKIYNNFGNTKNIVLNIYLLKIFLMFLRNENIENSAF